MMKLLNKLKSLLRRLDQLGLKLVKLNSMDSRVDWCFLVVFWALGRIALIRHYEWNLEMVLIVDIWMLPLFCIIRDISKRSSNNPRKPIIQRNHEAKDYKWLAGFC